MSYDACICISVSILTPNAFSIRKAIAPDRPVRPLSSADSAGRDTPSAVVPQPGGGVLLLWGP